MCDERPGRRLCQGNKTDDVLAKSVCIVSLHKECQGKEMNICVCKNICSALLDMVGVK